MNQKLTTRFPTATRQLAALARTASSAYRKTRGGRAAWLQGTFSLARTLRSARKQLPADRDFNAWLIKAGLRGLDKDARAALLTIGANVRAARAYFKDYESVSWRACAQDIRAQNIRTIEPITMSVSVSQIAKPPPSPVEISATLARVDDTLRQARPQQLHLVSSDGATPVDLQLAADAVMSFLPATMRITSHALAAYWRRERINSHPSAEQIRRAAHWLWTLVDALEDDDEPRVGPRPIDDSA